MSSKYGKLFVVATPIGNLSDFSFRAVETLKQVDLIAAEDTRHVRLLLQHYAISNKVVAMHQHNETKMAARLVQDMKQGLTVALVSDAGTPLLSDPGLPLVKLAKHEQLEVSPIPGACALIAALSVSGLAVNRFFFEGFLPRTSLARRAFLKHRIKWQATWVFYESSHRILHTLRDMAEILPLDRQIVVARELTKLYETILSGPLEEVLSAVEQDTNMRKGEFVVLVSAAQAKLQYMEINAEQERILTILLAQCTIKTAVAMAVEITGARKKSLYQAALRIQHDMNEET